MQATSRPSAQPRRGSARRSTASTARRNGCWRRRRSERTALAGATPYLRLFGIAAGGCLLAEQALAGLASRATARRARALARFFAENICVQALGLERTVTEGAGSVDGTALSLQG